METTKKPPRLAGAAHGCQIDVVIGFPTLALSRSGSKGVRCLADSQPLLVGSPSYGSSSYTRVFRLVNVGVDSDQSCPEQKSMVRRAIGPGRRGRSLENCQKRWPEIPGTVPGANVE
jgi:hypothetical protein